MSTLLADLRQALRGMRKAPALTIVVVLTLALGIGANSAIFSVINGVLLEPLEYPEPEKLVHITSRFTAQAFERFWIDPPEFMEYREWNQSYTDIAGYRAGEAGTKCRLPHGVQDGRAQVGEIDTRPSAGSGIAAPCNQGQRPRAFRENSESV